MSPLANLDQTETSQEWGLFLNRLRDGQPLALSLVSEPILVETQQFQRVIQLSSSLDLEILKRVYLNEESDEQIGRAMNLSLLQVKILKTSARARFTENLQDTNLADFGSDKKIAGSVLSLAHELQKLQAPAFMRALEVFGVQKRAIAWMETPNPALGNLPPLEAILYEDGQTEVFNILGRIEHGVLS